MFISVRILQDNRTTGLKLVLVDNVVPSTQRREFLAAVGPDGQVFIDYRVLVLIVVHDQLVHPCEIASVLFWKVP